MFDAPLPLAGEKLAPYQPEAQTLLGSLKGGQGMKELVAKNGEVICIDDDWHNELSKFAWRINGKGYAATYINKKYHMIHRMIMAHDLTEGFTVHHRNENKLDNRVANLVVVSKETHARIHSKRLRNNKKINLARYFLPPL
jgi:hypothetical protein